MMFRIPLAVLLLVPLLVRPSPAQISVSATGEATTSTAWLALRARVSVTAELAGDASSKFDQARRRALLAIENAALTGLSVQGQGTAFGIGAEADQNAMMQMMMMGREPGNTELQVHASEVFDLRLPLTDLSLGDRILAIAKLLDALRDSGATIDQPSMSRYQAMMWSGDFSEATSGENSLKYEPSDAAQLEREATEKAIANARRRAKVLADLAGISLGKVKSIRVSEPSGSPLSATPERIKQVVSVDMTFEIQ